MLSTSDFLFQEIRSQSFGSFERLLQFPFFDFGLIAREKDFWHLPSLVVGRTGVDRSCEEVILEGIGKGALFVADGSWDDSDDGIGHAGSDEFTTREDEIAEADFLCDEVLADAIVYALVVATEDDDVALER